MKAKMKLVNLLMLLMVSISIFSCSDGEDGTDGIDGVDGIDGIDGVNGVDGADGEQGDTGTANVIYSNWVNTELDGDTSSFDIEVNTIDSDILDFGTILVYSRRVDPFTSIPYIYQLPIVFGANRQQSYYFRATEGNLRITVVSTEEGGSAGDGSFLEQYRYIIIPGGVEASNGIGGISGKSSNSKSSQDYTSMSYEEITTLFNIDK
ncbi:lipoprotein [Zobellia galactanivorans]|uniref:Conserved hypothetical lipoprotein n=1 Tax=Zobellia galactanivorans (strain DSM 12802 / CCUG 47099 / CIP 106680 / NCIMB 13871 / Dsij) TaxID=63186 RepID=G0L0P5_ZOBGA|nr:lipoprotein [Zobellia galactanivorans]CAZ97548.1 Conserved hypothetical lipoprotein [Zobellia galactanivorans]